MRLPLIQTRFKLPFLRYLLISQLSFAVFAPLIDARTTSFSPRDTNVLYLPARAWVKGGGNSSMRSIEAGAKLQIKFAGEQITLFGSTSSSLVSINLDGEPVNSNLIAVPSRSASPSNLFQASDLDENREHSLELEIGSNETFVLNRIAVAFSASNENIPALLPLSGSSTSSPNSLSTSVPLQSAASSTPLSTSSAQETTSESPSPGVAVGATIGALLACCLLILLPTFLIRRHRKRSLSRPSSRDSRTDGRRTANGPYVNQETGTRRGSFILSAFQNRRASSLLFWNSTPRTPLSPSPILFNDNNNALVNGGIGSSPRAQLPPLPTSSTSRAVTPVIVGSETWQVRLARAASWKRRTERLAETRKFYGVGGRAVAIGSDLRGPPPAVPLPRPPEAMERGDGVREMEERWRVEEASLEVRGRGGGKNVHSDYSPPMSISPYLIATPPEDPSVVKREGGGGEDNRFEQAYGQAISTNDDFSSIKVASPTSTVCPRDSQHIRRRSNPNVSTKPLPFSPTESAFSTTSSSRPILPTFYQNPFTLTRTLTTTTSHSFDESTRSSIENARISQAQARPIRSQGGGGIGNSLPINLPVRGPSSQLGSLNEGTVRAGPRGDTTVGLIPVVETEVMVERKPSLTRILNGKVIENGEGSAPHPRGRHKSVAAVVVGGGGGGETEDGGEAKMRSSSSMEKFTRVRRREPELPSEEDRPDYFLKREVIPKYSQEAGDPRMRGRK
ncbi:hypothetical protein JCM5350_001470 [Sporobolomyces pararoseus]